MKLLRGDSEAAARTFEQLRLVYRSLGNAAGEFAAAVLLAEAEHLSGHTQRAIEIVHEILPALRSVEDKSLLGNALENLAGYLLATGDSSGAVSVAREAIDILAEHDSDHVYIGISIEHLALAYALRGELERAARQEGFSNALLERSGFEREFTETTTHERLMKILREELAPEELARLLAEGAALTSEAAIALALEDRGT
ncbi:MAG: hypothetical protein IAI49_13745 [Candidatus Eremiobacteraeota bacterium]|nr:hypothetical protein [Candidatus Eremiobacteraeota bacterium]